MTNQKDIQRKIFNLTEGIRKNPEGGTINLTGCVNRYTVGAKTILQCKLEYYISDVEHYKRKLYDELFKNYISEEFPINYDTLGWWVSDSWLYIDLGFRMSDKHDAIKFASFNNEIAIWDNREEKEILTNNYNL